MQLARVPGTAITTVHGDEVSVEGFGVRRAGTDDKVTGDTVFEAASLSKPVFASIVMTIQRSSINEALGWGSGIGLEHAGGHHYVWHWGDNPGFKNFVVGEPATGSAIVIFTNGNAGQRVYERVIRARTGVDHPAFLWL